MEKETLFAAIYLECMVEVEENWEYHPPRVEECHGYHSFSEDELIDSKIVKVALILGHEKSIDITSRLTKEELDSILANNEI